MGAAGAQEGYGSGRLSVTLGHRPGLLMAEDLDRKRFLQLLVKSDQIYVFANDAFLTVDSVDAEKRAMAGAIELTATGAP